MGLFIMVQPIYRLYTLLLGCLAMVWPLTAQIDVEHVISIGRNALYFNDYVVSIGYFNQAIDTRPWLADPYFYRSVAKINLEDYKGAEQDATLCLERNPFITKAYLVRGIARQNLSLLTEAIADYRQGLILAPDNIGMHLNLSLAYTQLKQYDKAEEALDDLLRYSAKNKNAYSLRADIALQRGDTTLALKRIDESLQLDSMQVMPYKLKAQIASARSELGVGIEALTRAIYLEPREANLYTHRGIMYYRLNKLREAMMDYNEALSLESRHSIARHNRALLRQLVGELELALEDWDLLLTSQPKNYIGRYNRALLARRLGKPAKALADLDVVLKQYPSFVEGFLLRSELRKILGDTKGAERDHWHAWDLQHNKNYRQAALRSARRQGERDTRRSEDESIDKYNMLIEETPSSTPEKLRYSSAARGRVQDREVQIEPQGAFYLTYFLPQDPEGKPQSGSPAYAELLLQFDKRSGLPYRLSLSSRSLTLQADQISWLQSELIRAPEMSEADFYLHRGIVHSLLQDYEQAIADYDRAIALDPTQALAYFARSIATDRKRLVERSQASESSPTIVQEIVQTVANSHSHLPATLPKITQLPLSSSILNDLNRTIELAPDLAYAYYNRAVYFAQRGDDDAAMRDYNRAIELAPRLVEAYYNRGLLLLAQGKAEQGIRDLSQAGQWGLYEAYNIIKRMNQ